MMHELGVLKHVSYVLEAFASEATGDGKRELTKLIERVGSDQAISAECREELLRRLTSAQTAIEQGRDLRGPIGDVSGAVAYLWSRVKPGWLPYEQ